MERPAVMGTPLRVLIVDDSENDAALLLRELHRGGYTPMWKRVETGPDMTTALAAEPWDLVIADYSLPHFSGPAALTVMQESGLDLPFIIVSGAVGEDVAVAMMKAGAHDYVMKSNLVRLVPAIGRELREAEVRRERRRVEDALRGADEFRGLVMQQATDAIFALDLNGRFTLANRRTSEVTGYSAAELIGRSYATLFAGEVAPEVNAHFRAAVTDGVAASGVEVALTRKDGSVRIIQFSIGPLRQEGQVVGVVGTAEDITERKRAVERTAVLLEIAQDISGTFDLAALLDRVQRRIVRVLPCDAVVTFLADARGDTFRMAAHHGLPVELLPDALALEFSVRQVFDGRLVNRQTIVINDFSRQSWLSPEFTAHFQLHALLVVPLRVRGRSLGALVALRRQSPHPFSADEAEFANGIAQEVAMGADAIELYRAQQEEAEVAGALARVGQELIASLDTPLLLERLCRLTTEVLQCDASRTWLRQPDEDAFSLVSGYGGPPEEHEVIRTLKLPRALMADLVVQLESQGVTQVVLDQHPDGKLPEVLRQLGIPVSLFMPLRRGDEVLGFQTASLRSRTTPFTKQQERIARGIGQLASVALANARLVEELERANRVKSDFVATVSHELRTPLNVIMGYNDLVLEGLFGPLTPEQRESLERVGDSACQLRDLINATLDVSRMEAGQVSLTVADVDLAALIAQIDVETRDLQEKPGLRCVWQVAPDLPPLRTDAAKLKVVVKNLVTNAVKFTAQGSVTVAAAARADGIEITVSDTGIGIKSETLPIIFGPFQQGDSSITRGYGGVGLGLYIVRQLLDMLGGTITVDSVVDRGSTFRIWLPLSGPSRGRREPLSHAG